MPVSKDLYPVAELITPHKPLTFTTGAGLTASGSVALFKVVTVTATGRERASPSLKVTRP